MPWIEHCSQQDIALGWHHDAGPNSMLIQITDPGTEFVTPKYSFKQVHQFEFLDVESDGLTNLGDGVMTDVSELAITDDQAKQLAELLQYALKNHMNTIVHCFAGLCRSSAVAVVGVELGFEDVEKIRMPNRLVINKMLSVLGLPKPANLDKYKSRNGVLIPPDMW